MLESALGTLLEVAVVVFAVSSMLSVGFGHTAREILGPLRHRRGVIVALVANFVLVPLLALAIVYLLPLGRGFDIGLIVLASAAGAPFVIKLTETAGGDVALSTALLVLLLLGTVVYMPLVVPLVVPEGAVDAGAIAAPLVWTMLLPLAVSLAVRGWLPRLATSLRPAMSTLSSLALVVLVGSTVVANLDAILGVFGKGAILAAFLTIAGGFLAGYLLGGPGRATRSVLALATAQRNIAAATVVATQTVRDPDTIVMVVVASVVSMLLLFPVARALRRRAERAIAAAEPGADIRRPGRDTAA
jgi:bile acid:Na+ symporter, BASS family